MPFKRPPFQLPIVVVIQVQFHCIQKEENKSEIKNTKPKQSDKTRTQTEKVFSINANYQVTLSHFQKRYTMLHIEMRGNKNEKKKEKINKNMPFMHRDTFFPFMDEWNMSSPLPADLGTLLLIIVGHP